MPILEALIAAALIGPSMYKEAPGLACLMGAVLVIGLCITGGY